MMAESEKPFTFIMMGTGEHIEQNTPEVDSRVDKNKFPHFLHQLARELAKEENTVDEVINGPEGKPPAAKKINIARANYEVINGPGGKPHAVKKINTVNAEILGVELPSIKSLAPFIQNHKTELLSDPGYRYLYQLAIDFEKIKTRSMRFQTFQKLYLSLDYIFAESSRLAPLKALMTIGRLKLTNFTFVGWSRGAMESIWTVNVLNDLIALRALLIKNHQDTYYDLCMCYPWFAELPSKNNLQINLFLIEPVGSYSHHNHEKVQKIPTIVSKAYIIRSIDEYRNGFKPLAFDIHCPSQTIYLPGHHSMVVKTSNETQANVPLADVVKLLWRRFCIETPVNLHTDDGVADIDLDLILAYLSIKAVEKIIIKKSTNHLLAYYLVQGGKKARYSGAEKRSFFFVNQHHRQLTYSRLGVPFFSKLLRLEEVQREITDYFGTGKKLQNPSALNAELDWVILGLVELLSVSQQQIYSSRRRLLLLGEERAKQVLKLDKLSAIYLQTLALLKKLVLDLEDKALGIGSNVDIDRLYEALVSNKPVQMMPPQTTLKKSAVPKIILGTTG